MVDKRYKVKKSSGQHAIFDMKDPDNPKWVASFSTRFLALVVKNMLNGKTHGMC